MDKREHLSTADMRSRCEHNIVYLYPIRSTKRFYVPDSNETVVNNEYKLQNLDN